MNIDKEPSRWISMNFSIPLLMDRIFFPVRVQRRIIPDFQIQWRSISNCSLSRFNLSSVQFNSIQFWFNFKFKHTFPIIFQLECGRFFIECIIKDRFFVVQNADNLFVCVLKRDFSTFFPNIVDLKKKILSRLIQNNFFVHFFFHSRFDRTNFAYRLSIGTEIQGFVMSSFAPDNKLIKRHTWAIHAYKHTHKANQVMWWARLLSRST